jgi:hypothetical protein
MVAAIAVIPFRRRHRVVPDRPEPDPGAAADYLRCGHADSSAARLS